jgi:signal transduction histidine kinase
MLSVTQFTILVIDDNPTNLGVIVDYLEAKNFTVLVAQDGESGLKRANYAHPDLILLDVLMPGMDGFETCLYLKQNAATYEIPVIFMTALSNTEDKVKGFAVGAVDYVTKPVQQEELLARIQVHLKLQELSKTLEEKNKLLAERNSHLEATLTELKQAQIQIIQSEKMSSLGQLVAGVAHEINNPLNFVDANLNYVQGYTEDLLDFVRLYDKHYPDPIPEIQAKANEIDIEFLQTDLSKLLNSMRVGTERINQIVLSLRNFSRMDEAEFKAVDIHDGLDSTLLILQHRLKATAKRAEIQIIRNYADLPLIECYAGQLNQVFMNILANAIDAIDEASDQQVQDDESFKMGCIQISTALNELQHESPWVKICISDNGSGIPQHIKQKIFEPFFTTKPTGKGTGMGMSISYQIIVEKHGGLLNCCSTAGAGTEFVIQIPVQQPIHDEIYK